MIILLDIMIQVGLIENFKLQVIQWGINSVSMKEPRDFLCQTDLTSCDMREVVMQTQNPVFIR